MQAIIVAGGRGVRLRPITDHIPKPMVEVAGKPILEHTINLLKNNGVTDLILALCYLPEVIVNYFGDGKKFGVNIHYTYEDSNCPLGTAGAIRASREYINDDFIVTYADILRKLNINDMIKQHKTINPIATINAYKRYGKDAKSMIIFDSKNMVTSFKERPKVEDIVGDFVWSNGSFYIFNKNIFDYFGSSNPVDFGKDIFSKIIDSGQNIRVYKTDDYFIDIGNLEKLEKAKATFIP